jgi:long-subunit acyl-CoA synthetase (AMP-forming)
MTECGILFSNPVLGYKLASVGLIVPGAKAKVISCTTGKCLPANQEGEICVTGPSLMSGYMNMDEATKQSFDEEGCLKTGEF